MSFKPREAQEDFRILLMVICLLFLLVAGVVSSIYRYDANNYRAVAANPASGFVEITCTQPGDATSPLTAKLQWAGGEQSFSYDRLSHRGYLCARQTASRLPVVFPADDPGNWFTHEEYVSLEFAYWGYFGALAAVGLCLIGFGFAVWGYLKEKQFQRQY